MSDQQPPPTGVPTCYRHPGRETYIRCQRCERPICPDCMHEAAVGFQCPDCVRLGAKQTRTGRATYGGKRSDNPLLTSLVLIAINLGVWLLIMATGGRTSEWVDRLALLPKGRCLHESDPTAWYPHADEIACTTLVPGEWYAGVADGAWWQLVTSMFTHVEIWHLGANMLALYFFGPVVESMVGRARFLAIYLLSGLTSSVLVFWLSPVYGLTVGASGAIFGLFGAVLVLAIKQRRNLTQLLLLLALNFYITFTIPNISWQGHLGGFVGGAAIAALLAYAPRSHRSLLQGLGLGALVVVLALATVGRVAVLT